MFSKSERNYILGTFFPSESHKRVLNHRIKKKINEFYKNEFELIQKFSVTKISNITEFSNNKIISEGTRSPFSEGKRSLERGTNPRPNAYEAFALPG
jgi:hypothetical protein